ncbi:MAG TPA: glycosyltransferase [Candidatus Nitrosocosmicus sp.]|nr:glycosyltransferase [Candidatus Nitrosocosmicus sp.]
MVFLSSDVTEPTLLTALFATMIVLCYYLYLLSLRSSLLIPIIKSNEKNCFCIKKIKLNDNNNNVPFPYSSNNCIHNSKDKKSGNLNPTKYRLTNLPFVSIIVPARNEENHIERCLLSLLSQEYPYFEIIAIDDSSTDGTLKIMHDIKDKTNKKKKIGLPTDKLKIISLKDKPENWTGKTWASQQGYLQSKGNVLLFTDADTNYVGRDVILQTVLYMQKHGLDVLTGVFSPEKLSNFWSKITIPLWDSVSVLFGVGSPDVNNPKSKIAYVMGSYFLIKRKVFVDIGTFKSVCQEIQEDKALGILIKKSGYKIKLVRLNEMMYTIWADDLITLWHGIGRTLAPLVMNNRFKVISNLFIILFASILPFALFPVTLWIAFEELSFIPPYNILLNIYFYLPLLNLIPCVLMFISFSSGCKKYKIKSIYYIGSFVAAVFVIVACLYNIAPLLIFGKTKPISWQGRQYTYVKGQNGFTI